MDFNTIIDKFYKTDNELKRILLTHSHQVAKKAMTIVDKHPELHADKQFVEEAAMLHDIGIIHCDAKGIYCFGDKPYICHGYIGAEMLRKEGLERHALVCERHTGAGISLESIIKHQLPIPHRNMLPCSIEEQIICYADKFFSKTHLGVEKSEDEAISSLLKFGEEGVERFKEWSILFQ